MYEQNLSVRGEIFKLFANCGCDPEDPGMATSVTTEGSNGNGSRTASLKQLLCCLPQVEVPPHVLYENVFRVIIMQFLDAHNFDVRSVKKSCVHIVHPDGRIIPFDTFNLFYRDEREQKLTTLRVKARELTIA